MPSVTADYQQPDESGQDDKQRKRLMIRRAPVVTGVAATVLAALALAGAGSSRSAHTEARLPSRAARLAASSSPLAPAPADGVGSPAVNLALYRKCANPATYGQDQPEAVSTFVAGYSDARKLGNALQVGFPALALAASSSATDGFLATSVVVHNRSINCSLVRLHLDYRGSTQLPPLKATLLGFGFAPVTATATLSQVGSAPLTTVIYQDAGPPSAIDPAEPFTVVSVARLQLRLTNVAVNGVALDVGPSCLSKGILYTPGNQVAPGELELTGGTDLGDPVPSFANALSGGAVAGEATIPPFTGCITPSGENLDPLLTASVSGPGNYVRIVAGPECFGGSQCTAAGLPQFVPLWTVTHGGNYSASGPLTLAYAGTDGLTITCAHSVVSGEFPDETGPLRGGLASVLWSGISGCKGSDGTKWQIAQHGTAFFGPKIFGQVVPGQTAGNVDNLAFDLTGEGTGTGGGCHIFMAGYSPTSYADSLLTVGTGIAGEVHIFSSDCPDAPADSPTNAFGDFAVSAAYQIRPAGITVTSP
jgi:hypothetical protein